MLSRLKAALIFSSILLSTASPEARGAGIGRVEWPDTRVFSREELKKDTFLEQGVEFTDSLEAEETARLDSLYFSKGYLSSGISVNGTGDRDKTDLKVSISEGDRAVIGDVVVTGDESLILKAGSGLNVLREGDPFSPGRMREAMGKTLDIYNRAGFPFAQVWVTGFRYDERKNLVNISFSVVSGEEARIGGILFEGLTKTDTSVALSASRLEKGDIFDEEMLSRAERYLKYSGLFAEVSDSRVARSGKGSVTLVIPVEEKEKNNFFEGVFGFSREDDGDYEINGYLDLKLNNLAGSGRNAGFSWLNDGKKYSKTEISYYEPFLFSSRVALGLFLRQTVQDSLYNMNSAGVEAQIPLGFPGFSAVVGASFDRNVPGYQNELERSVRQRYRVGIERASGEYMSMRGRVEGARKKNYLTGNRAEKLWQYLYMFEFRSELPTFFNQSLYFRLLSQGVFSSGEISPAELYSLGGARTLRGYRENQFRGERVSYFNLEYRFGRESRIFVFDDLGSYYRDDDGWKIKNGLGFGIRSVSAVGTVELSFGMTGDFSLDEARIHVSLIETF